MAQVKGECRRPDCPLQTARTASGLSDQTRLSLADAYAAQSASDWAVYDGPLKEAEECHRLHYLQMACEKIAKAYRQREADSFRPGDLYSHVIFSRFIMGFLKSAQVRNRYHSQEAKRRQIERYAHSLSGEIEKMAPAVDRDLRPANAEYPWEQGGTVFVPCRHRYPLSARLAETDGREFLKLVEIAIKDYQSITLNG